MAEHHRALGLGASATVASVEPSSTTRTSKPGACALDVADDAADHALLVVGGDDGQQAQILDGLRKA